MELKLAFFTVQTAFVSLQDSPITRGLPLCQTKPMRVMVFLLKLGSESPWLISASLSVPRQGWDLGAAYRGAASWQLAAPHY